MSQRVPAKRVFTFISFHACSPGRASGSTRALNTHASNCLRNGGQQRWVSAEKEEVKRFPRRFKRDFHSSSIVPAQKDPYQALGVAKDASLADIKKSYYSLARKYHPDTNKEKGAQEKFVEIQTAYDTLSDEKKRAAYDRYGAASQEPGFDPDAFANARGPFGGGGFAGFQDFGAAFGAGSSQGSADLFEQLFGSAFGGRGRARAGSENIRGDDLEARIGISFLDAAKGVKRTINITPISNCSTCSGSGLKPGVKKSTCTSCGGTGTRTFVIDSGFQMASTCGSCQGTGTTVPRGGQCSDCGGLGKVRIRKSVSVDIPAGVEDGMTIRVPNEGDAPVSGKGPRGDLLVRVNVASSKVFRRQGANILHEARIPMHTALLGGRVRVPTLDGDVDVKVPGGTQQGEEMVLKGRGMPAVFGGDRGDLFVSFSIQLPRSLTKRQRELLQAYADDVEGRKAKLDSSTTTSEPPDRASDSVKETNDQDSAFKSNGSAEDRRQVDDSRERQRKAATG